MLLRVQEALLRHQSRRRAVAAMHRLAEIAEDRVRRPRLAFLWMQRALIEQPARPLELEVERLARAERWLDPAGKHLRARG